MLFAVTINSFFWGKSFNSSKCFCCRVIFID